MPLADLLPSASIAAAIAPALLLLWLVVAADSRPEPPGVVWTAFILGALSIVALHYLLLWCRPLLAEPDNPWLAIDQTALFLVGIPEETVKIVVIAGIALRARAFDEPMDGVVYGTAVGLGFAAYENLGYLANADDWETLAIVRGILTMPFHGALGAIAGAYIAGARFGGALGAHRHGRWVRARLVLLAWLIPVVLHTLFDIPLLTLRKELDQGAVTHAVLQAWGLVVGFGAIAFAVRLALRIAHHQHAWRSSRTPATAWRRIWIVLVLGAGVGFVGAMLVVSGVRQWQAGPNYSLFMFGLGGVLVLFAIVICAWSSKYLSEAAELHQTTEIKR